LYIVSGKNGHLSRTTDVPLARWMLFDYVESEELERLKPTAVGGKWFEVNDLIHSTTDAPRI
jgi:hypothetical protein